MRFHNIRHLGASPGAFELLLCLQSRFSLVSTGLRFDRKKKPTTEQRDRASLVVIILFFFI